MRHARKIHILVKFSDLVDQPIPVTNIQVYTQVAEIVGDSSILRVHIGIRIRVQKRGTVPADAEELFWLAKGDF